MAKVFISQGRAGFDYRKAERYGSIQFLTYSEFTPVGQPGVKRDHIMSEICENLDGYTPGDDYILLSGNPVIMVYIGAILEDGYHNILKWNNMTREYELCVLHLSLDSGW